MKKVCALVGILASGSVLAEAGDHMVHIGAMSLTPDDSSNSVMAKTPVGTVPTGLAANIEDAVTLGVGYSYFVTDNFAVGLQLGVPPTHDLIRSDDGVKVGEVEQISPDIKAEYYFGDNASFRPFIGGGLAFMSFDGTITDEATKQQLGSKVDVDGGLGVVGTIGVNSSISDNLFVRGSLSYLAFDTSVSFPDAVAIKAGQAEKVFADADVNPVIVYLAVGYSF